MRLRMAMLLATWRARLSSARQRAARDRHVLASAALVAAGVLGALGGGALIGRWCLGLVLIAESAGAVWWGLQRDDGAGRAPEGHTVPEILERARLAGYQEQSQPGSWVIPP